MVSLAFKADRLSAALLCVSVPASYIGPTVGAIAAKVLIDSFGEGQIGRAVLAGVLAAICVCAIIGSFMLNVYLVHALGKKVDVLVERQLATALLKIPGIEHYERRDYQDEIKLLRDNSDHLGAGLNAMLRLFAQVLQILAVCTLILSQSPLLLVLPLFSVPSLLATGVSNAVVRVSRERTAQSERLLHRIVGLASELPSAREARLFGLAEAWRQRRAQVALSVDAIQGPALTRSLLLRQGADFFFTVGYLGAVAFVLSRAASGALTAGDVALTVILGAQTQGFISGLVGSVKFIAAIQIVARRMSWLSDYSARVEDSTARPMACPSRLTKGIRLDRVSFRYPGTSRWALRDVSVSLPAGSVVAIVGENGAGKSSFAKLLLRLYEPDSGSILVDDVPLSQIDVDKWRAHVTGAFQDFCRFEFRVRESIGLGDSAHLDDVAVVAEAARGAGADHVVAGLPQGMDTQLGATWPSGMDLSGGQWQRLALARSKMRTNPLLAVMDEPTAAIDVHAEHEIFSSIADAAISARRFGGVTLLITHRFSSVKMADLIVVLNDGQVLEMGSHEDLVLKRGLYAELFEIQARAYSA